MLCACIDIGSNTTRLLVADAVNGSLTEVHQRKAFTRIGSCLLADAALTAPKIDEVAAVVAEQRAAAERLGAQALRVVATHAIRTCANSTAFCAAMRKSAGVEVEILDEFEEARLAFVGATRTFEEPLEGTVAVVDVGGGSSEIAVGTAPGDVSWSRSFALGSGLLSDAHLRADPPAAADVAAMRAHAAEVLAELAVPPADVAIVVGGSATSLRRLIGPRLDHEALTRGLSLLAAGPAATVARRHVLEPQRVRLMSGAIVIMEAIADLLALPLLVARGGLREGVCLELVH